MLAIVRRFSVCDARRMWPLEIYVELVGDVVGDLPMFAAVW
jgi:hypothetical protein